MARTPGRQANETSDAILAFICQYKQGHDGIAPTITEIGASIGIDSKSHVRWYLNRLERAGKISIAWNSARAIMVTGGRWVGPAG